MNKTLSMRKHALSTREVDVIELDTTSIIDSKLSPTAVALVNSMSASDILRFANQYQIRHFVQSTGGQRVNRVKKAQEIVSKGTEGIIQLPQSLLIKPCHFHQSIKFHGSKEKEAVLSQVVTAIKKPKGGRRFMDDIRSIADEFFTNVLYNAFPGPNTKIPRTKEIILPFDRPGELHVCASDDEILIAVFDLFGSLEFTPFINRLHKTYAMGISRSMSYSSGGAGIGCRLVLDKSQRFWTILLKNKFTAFASIISLDSDAQSLNLDYKDIHFLNFSG